MTNVHFSSLWNTINTAAIQNLKLHDVSKPSLFLGVIAALGFGSKLRAQSPWHQTRGSWMFTETSSAKLKTKAQKTIKTSITSYSIIYSHMKVPFHPTTIFFPRKKQFDKV